MVCMQGHWDVMSLRLVTYGYVSLQQLRSPRFSTTSYHLTLLGYGIPDVTSALYVT